jgi:hypothetical protein
MAACAIAGRAVKSRDFAMPTAIRFYKTGPDSVCFAADNAHSKSVARMLPDCDSRGEVIERQFIRENQNAQAK